MSFDFDAAVRAPFRMQPGLRRVADGTPALTPLEPGARHQREKLAVLSTYAAQALLARDGFDAGPALDAACRAAATEHADVFTWDGARAGALGVVVDRDGGVGQLAAGRFGVGDEVARCLRGLAPPWRCAGLLSLAFAEDLAVVDATDATIPWLAVCLPSFWAPESKIGLGFAAVHAQVADNALVVGAGDALVKLVTGAERWERFVWTVTPHPRLHAHPDRVDPRRWDGTSVERAFFRSERQGFVPIAGRRQALFTIEVDATPLAEAVDTTAKAARLHDAVASMSDAVLDYRGLAPVRGALLGWLAARAR